jgi:hypothetical protein
LSALLDIVRRYRAELGAQAAAVADDAPIEPTGSLYRLYPDGGPLRRALYQRHLQFFAAGGYHDPIETWCPEDCDGSPHRERLALCANRVGKTLGMGGYETALHLTGRYPEWWIGHRFDRPIEAWSRARPMRARATFCNASACSAMCAGTVTSRCWPAPE